jgi:hypothetical protein
MPYHIGVGGAWKLVNNCHIGVGGVWKQVQKMHIGVGGVWKEFYTYLSVNINNMSDQDDEISPTDAVCSLSLNSGGTITSVPSNSAAQTWLTAGAASAVDVRLTQNSLTGAGVMGGAALATWLNCGTTRTWTLTNTTNGNNNSTFTGTMELRDATTLAVLDSATVTLSANVSV